MGTADPASELAMGQSCLAMALDRLYGRQRCLGSRLGRDLSQPFRLPPSGVERDQRLGVALDREHFRRLGQRQRTGPVQRTADQVRKPVQVILKTALNTGPKHPQ